MDTLLLEFTIILAFAAALGGLLVAFQRNIQYRIAQDHLEVRVMGAIVRQIRLDDIKSISTKRPFWSETWSNCLWGTNRHLVIERYSGFFRNLVITPPYRFVFRAELLEAKKNYASSLADRPVLVLPGPSLVEWIQGLFHRKAATVSGLKEHGG